MKQIMQTARNLNFSVVDGKLKPVIELVITTIEPSYEMSGMRMNPVDVLETYRMFLSPESARAMAANLVSYADEVDALASEVKP